MEFIIEDMKTSDWPQIAAIYSAGIKTEIATFQKDVPSWEEWDQGHSKSCRLVARSGDLKDLIKRSEEDGYWTLQSGIIKENIPSRELHKKCGFREIGYRERVGKMYNGKWHDVILVERRSNLVG